MIGRLVAPTDHRKWDVAWTVEEPELRAIDRALFLIETQSPTLALDEPNRLKIAENLERSIPLCPLRLEGLTASVLLDGEWKKTEKSLSNQQAIIANALIKVFPGRLDLKSLKRPLKIQDPARTFRLLAKKIPDAIHRDDLGKRTWKGPVGLKGSRASQTFPNLPETF